MFCRIQKMTEAEYEYECRRAELLGIDIPSREEFFSRKHSDVEQVTDAEDGAEVTEVGFNLKNITLACL